MVIEKYDSQISKDLPIIERPKDGILSNYYPHYVVGKSTKIAEEVWNTNQFTMNYYVFWESDNRECGYPEVVGVRFRIYQGGEYIATCSVRYNCDSGEIISFEVKILKDTTTVQATDVEKFINKVIEIFGFLAFHELDKLKVDRKNPSQTTEIPHDDGDSTTSDGRKISDENDETTKNHAKRYVKSSWQKHGYYKRNRTYVKSSICHRNFK